VASYSIRVLITTGVHAVDGVLEKVVRDALTTVEANISRNVMGNTSTELSDTKRKTGNSATREERHGFSSLESVFEFDRLEEESIKVDGHNVPHDVLLVASAFLISALMVSMTFSIIPLLLREARASSTLGLALSPLALME
jgi:hypothetical protein